MAPLVTTVSPGLRPDRISMLSPSLSPVLTSWAAVAVLVEFQVDVEYTLILREGRYRYNNGIVLAVGNKENLNEKNRE